MNILSIFQTEFFTFSCDELLTDRILELVKKEYYTKNISNTTSSNDLFFDKELFDWFDGCLNEAKQKIGYPSNVSLPITSCWTNKSKKMMAHHTHSHPNSIISGVFYLTDHDCAPTIFYQENIWTKNVEKCFFIDKSAFSKNITSKIYPKKSTLILFPSDIEHSVPAVSSNEERYTIAFNTYVSGLVNHGLEKCRLEIKAKSVRDHYESVEQK